METPTSVKVDEAKLDMNQPKELPAVAGSTSTLPLLWRENMIKQSWKVEGDTVEIYYPKDLSKGGFCVFFNNNDEMFAIPLSVLSRTEIMKNSYTSYDKTISYSLYIDTKDVVCLKANVNENAMVERNNMLVKEIAEVVLSLAMQGTLLAPTVC